MIDEYMSPFDAATDKHGDGTGAPGMTKIIRKPLGVGHELKSVADVKTKMIIRLEFQSGAKDMQNAPFNGQYQSHTALLLRMVIPWRDTWRYVLGDSAFGSLASAQCLLDHGFHFGFIPLLLAYAVLVDSTV